VEVRFDISVIKELIDWLIILLLPVVSCVGMDFLLVCVFMGQKWESLRVCMY